MEARAHFDLVTAEMLVYEHVDPGKMMNCDGIRYKSKVFAFYWKDQMIFRLGKGYDPATRGITEWEWLNPFKNKPPMKGWYVIPVAYAEHWGDLADLALQVMKKELDK